jgi:hypothetical protein
MSAAPSNSKIAVITAGEPTLFDSLARLVPDELQAAYYRVLAHTRTLNPDDEMLRILEAMGILTLLTRQTPKDIADERERLHKMFDLHRQLSDEAREKMHGYVHGLETRISALPKEIEANIDPKRIAKLLGESLGQHFFQSGISDTVKGLEATSTAMTSAQRELSTALHNLSNSRGVVAQIESANDRLTQSMESRAKAVDSLLHEWKSDLLRNWIPLIAGAALLIGLFSGMGIQGCRDSTSAAAATPAPMTLEAVPAPQAQENGGPVGSPKQQRDNRERGKK